MTIPWTGRAFQTAVFTAACFVFLAPLLYFPVSPDLAFFALGGKTILAGDALYQDFVDIKPPLIYFVLAFIQLVFGDAEISFRLFDILFQAGIALSIVIILPRHGFSRSAALLSAAIYCLSYTIQNYTSTLQRESLVGLPYLWAVHWFLLRRNRWQYCLLIGIAAGSAFSLKFTMGVVLAPMLLAEFVLLREEGRSIFRRWLLIGLGFVLGVAVFFGLPFLKPGVAEGYGEVMQFLRDYISIQPFSLVFIRDTMKYIPMFFAEKYSLTLLFCLAVALGRYLMSGDRDSTVFRNWTAATILILVFLLFSIILERKYIPYHFSRMFVFLSPLAAIGLLSIGRRFYRRYVESGRARRLILALVITGLIFVSPLPRYFNILRPALSYLTDRERYDTFYEVTHPNESSVIRVQQLELRGFINQRRNPGDRVFVAATHAGMIYYFLGETPVPKFPSSIFYGAPWSLPQWKAQFEEGVRQAQWLVVHTNDLHPVVSGTLNTSNMVVEQHAGVMKLLEEEFEEVQRFAYFNVYRKKGAQ